MSDRAVREFSAGGVVFRRAPQAAGGAEVVVIVPHKRSAEGERVLGLPKGHPEEGERPEETAAREVREEAGVSGRFVEKLGDVRYWYVRQGQRRPKTVAFYLFEYGEGDPSDHDHEIERARWLDIERAAAELTYPGEREMVARALSKLRAGL